MASSFPTTLDNFVINYTNATINAITHPAAHNDVADAVNKIEAELGTDPSGAFASVKARLDDGISIASPADDSATGFKATLTAGETLVQNNVVYIKSDGKVWKADADTIATAPVIGLAPVGIAVNNPGVILLHGLMRDDSGFSWTVGGLLYLSTTVGTITQTAPSGTNNVIQILGVALSADIIYFNPQLVVIEHA